jgi:hypothetical protein
MLQKALGLLVLERTKQVNNCHEAGCLLPNPKLSLIDLTAEVIGATS